MPNSRPVFVFGSNLSGVHGAGAAKVALLQHGAQLGVGSGPTGNAYALPTKGLAPTLPCLTLSQIQANALQFCGYAMANPQLQFQLTAVGCGLAGNHPRDIAPMFLQAPANVLYPPEWRSYLTAVPEARFWTYAQMAQLAAPRRRGAGVLPRKPRAVG